MFKLKIFAILISIILFATMAHAENNEIDTSATQIEFAPPDLSAFTLLGVNPNQISRPGSIKDFSAAFLNISGHGSDIAPGIAIEWTPSRMIPVTSLEKYSKDWWRRIQLTFGTANDTTGTSTAIGLKWVIVDKSNPLGDLDYLRSLEKPKQKSLSGIGPSIAIKYVLDSLANSISGGDEDLTDKIFNSLSNVFDMSAIFGDTTAARSLTKNVLYYNGLAAIKDVVPDSLIKRRHKDILMNCSQRYIEIIKETLKAREDSYIEMVNRKEKFKKDKWNALVAHFATALVGHSDDSKWKTLQSQSWRSYAGVAIPFNDYGQIIFQVKLDGYRDKGDFRKWGYSMGQRLLVGGGDKRVNFEAMYQKPSGINGESEEAIWRYSFTGEFKMSTGLWLEIGIANESQKGNTGDDKIITLANLKYAFNNKPKIVMPN